MREPLLSICKHSEDYSQRYVHDISVVVLPTISPVIAPLVSIPTIGKEITLSTLRIIRTNSLVARIGQVRIVVTYGVRFEILTYNIVNMTALLHHRSEENTYLQR